MLSWFKKQPSPSAPVSVTMRELLFGDLPLERWTGDGQNVPWNKFARVQTLLGKGDRVAAIAVLQEIVDTTDVESRHTLQAWHFLRELEVRPPPAIAKQVLGVVVEVALPEGLDVLAAYRDHQARYWNWSGAGVVWEHPDIRLDGLIDAVLDAGQSVVARIGPWERERPAPVTGDSARLNFLTPSGLHFGEGPMSDLMRDSLAAPFIQTATQLMIKMTELAPA